jgi:hypothetical protein
MGYAHYGGRWSLVGSPYLRSVVAVESVLVLIERGLVDDAAVIERTLFEIELQLGAIKNEPQLAGVLIQRTDWHRLRRMKAVIEYKRPLPGGVTAEAFSAELEKLGAAGIPSDVKKRYLAEKADLLHEYDTLYSLLSDIAHVSPMGLSHYIKQDRHSAKYRFNSGESLLTPEYVMVLAAATQLNILELVVEVLKDTPPHEGSILRQENGTLIHNIKTKGL